MIASSGTAIITAMSTSGPGQNQICSLRQIGTAQHSAQQRFDQYPQLSPLTGVLYSGDMLLTSILVALNLINQQQRLLPGYEVHVEFRSNGYGTDFFLHEVFVKFAFIDA